MNLLVCIREYPDLCDGSCQESGETRKSKVTWLLQQKFCLTARRNKRLRETRNRLMKPDREFEIGPYSWEEA